MINLSRLCRIRWFVLICQWTLILPWTLSWAFFKAAGKAKSSFTSYHIERGQANTKKDETSLKHAAATIYAGGSDTVLNSLYLPAIVLIERVDRIGNRDVLPCNDPLSWGAPPCSGRSRFRCWERSTPDLWGSGGSSIHECSHKRAHTLGTNITHRFGMLLVDILLTLSDIVLCYLWKALPHLCTREDTYAGYRIPKGSIIIPNIWYVVIIITQTNRESLIMVIGESHMIRLFTKIHLLWSLSDS